MKTYPVVSKDEKNIPDIIRQIVRTRNFQDIPDRDNFNNIFIQGRSTNRVPSGTADVLDTDRIGDFFATASYLYILVNDSGTAKWIRYAGGTW